ncbi:MAG: FadR/GntR family transcriptional regulator [Victivallaceae bacterium]|nr:FadR/GntR family transcriptional regulator [Victivallaceae bacterium]
MFKPVANKRIYQQVVDQIQTMILDGRLKAGDKLPAERDLTELFQVSRTSIREAVRALEILGLVECRQGGGNFIRKEFNTGLFEPLSIMFKLHNGSALELFKVRKMLEIEAVSLAAGQITAGQRAELKAVMEELAAAEKEEDKAKLDAEFHFRIMEASGNYLLQCFYNAVSSLMQSFIGDARKIFLKAEKMSILAELHREICNAVVSGQAAPAVAAMRKHFDFVIDNLEK